MRAYTNAELDAIVLAHKDTVYRLARLNTRSTADADDVFQTVFLEFVRRDQRFESDEMAKAWLIRRTLQRCCDLYRTAWKKRVIGFGDAQYGVEDEMWIEGDGPEEPIRSLTFAAVQNLPPKLRDVIYLFYYEEYSVRETASILQIGEGAAKTRLNRAREMLKKQLGGIFHA